MGGYCNVTGQCLCHPGWTGTHCNICEYYIYLFRVLTAYDFSYYTQHLRVLVTAMLWVDTATHRVKSVCVTQDTKDQTVTTASPQTHVVGITTHISTI